MPDALALFASSRRNGNTGQLMDRIARELDIEVIDLATKKISAYDYEHRNRSDDFEPLMKRVLECDQLILASPVYWYGVSPPMKVFLDRITDFLDLPDLLADGRRLRGKQAWVVCTSIYPQVPPSFLGALVDTFDYLGITYAGIAHADCSEGYVPAIHDAEAIAFAERIRNAKP
jgi:multimeric flavodoxin WrbA